MSECGSGARWGVRLAAAVLIGFVLAPTHADDSAVVPGSPSATWVSGSLGAIDSGHWAGDCNCDGQVNFYDIDPFILALSDPQGYMAQYPNCNILQADMNCDGVVNFLDITAFVSFLNCLECPHNPWYCG